MVWSIFRGTDSDRPGHAAALIIAALTLLSFQDALVKFASADTSLWQFQVFRSGFNICLILVGVLIAGQLPLLRAQNPVAVAARSCVMVMTMVLFFSGSPFISLAEMGAGLYTYPVFTTFLGWLVLREEVGRWRVAAMIVAVIGAVLIVRPWHAEFHPAQVLPIGAGFCYSVNSLILRRYCRQESPVTMAFWSTSAFMTAALVGIVVLSLVRPEPALVAEWPFILDAWPVLLWSVVGIAALASFCNVVGNVLVVKAYQSAELSWLAPIDYSYLILATFWGVVLFADWPDAPTLAGMALIAAGSGLTAWREARLKRASTSPGDPVL